MLTLFSYPGLCGLADNNPYGLKVYAFLKLCRLDFRQEHLLDPSSAPRAQLPYLLDGEERIGDSDAIIAHLTDRYHLTIDEGLSADQRDCHLLVRRTLDDLYWVMSFSRWRDERFWPLFRDTFLREHPGVTLDALEAGREYNFRRYHYQGIGRYEPEAAYARGIADLTSVAHLLPVRGFMFAPRPCSLDAAIYGFVANIHFFEIDTPLKRCLADHPNLVEHCRAIHAMLATDAANR